MMFYNENDPKSVEKYSSAVSLSDMEIFIFPELIYSLVLANMMSPKLWQWKEDSWFNKLHKMNEYKRLQRTKQFIMERFVFNLDLDTWGLTTKDKELNRFSSFIDKEILQQSNALFGYEGDKYYFDIDIRRHFGLDQYTTEMIPYWKTETLEAMDAFKFKEGYSTGAGECVSLSTLYASALAIIGEVPLEKIHLLATPLHSQNFIDIKEGLITNNRRVVTKNMWFNGTELSAKARRALEHERITMLVNNSGYVHTMYPDGTMPQSVYNDTVSKLGSYLKSDITYEVIASFLRENGQLQKCFQVKVVRQGREFYIESEKIFHYEHASKSRLGSDSQKALLNEIEMDEFYPQPIDNRIVMAEIEQFFKNNPLPVDHQATKEALKKQLHHCCFNVEDVIENLLNFCHIQPSLPKDSYNYVEQPPISLDLSNGREGVIEQLEEQRLTNPMADLAFSAYRDLSRSPWRPFLKAAVERNPVVVENLAATKSLGDCYTHLMDLEESSIYEDIYRVAQPDEVWNFKRGDGLEKAISFLAVASDREKEGCKLEYEGSKVVVTVGTKEYSFTTKKRVAPVVYTGE